MKADELWTAAFYFAAALSGVLVLATLVKAWEVWRTRNWLRTTGKVVQSSVVKRRRKDNQGTLANYPEVAYEFTVDGQRLRGNKVNVTPPVADTMVEEVLNRYPMGTEVEVFYNPANPADCVLEREWPFGLGLGVLSLIAVIFGIAWGGPWLILHGQAELAKAIPRPDRAPAVILAGGAAVFVLMLAEALRRMQAEAKNWPTVTGKIVTSRLEAFLAPRESGSRIRHPSFRAAIIYQYQVGDRSYRGDRLTLGGRFTGSVRPLTAVNEVPVVDLTGGRAGSLVAPRSLQNAVAAHPVGADVDVYYDPKQPSSSVLQPVAGGTLWILVGVAAVIILLGVGAAGYFG